MKRFVILAILAGLLSTALAQPVTPPVEQALSERLIAEIQANVQARTQLIEVQRALAAAQTRIKELEKQAEVPKPEPPK